MRWDFSGEGVKKKEMRVVFAKFWPVFMSIQGLEEGQRFGSLRKRKENGDARTADSAL